MKRRLRVRLLILAFCPCLLAAGIVLGAAPQLRFERASSGYGVSVRLDGRTVLSSPAEGLWSIATGWKDGWPADWIHAGPAELRRQGEWTILTGELNTPSGRWLLQDAYRVEGDLVKCVRRFTWQGADTAKHTTLSVRFQCPGKGPGVLLPGVLYHGNPSGARSGRVPVYEGRPGEVAFFEEHRPI